MNHSSAVLIREAEGLAPKRKRNKRKSKVAPYLCPELDNIGHHVYEKDECKYCKCKAES